jgi:hypothetical protein
MTRNEKYISLNIELDHLEKAIYDNRNIRMAKVVTANLGALTKIGPQLATIGVNSGTVTQFLTKAGSGAITPTTFSTVLSSGMTSVPGLSNMKNLSLGLGTWEEIANVLQDIISTVELIAKLAPMIIYTIDSLVTMDTISPEEASKKVQDPLYDSKQQAGTDSEAQAQMGGFTGGGFGNIPMNTDPTKVDITSSTKKMTRLAANEVELTGADANVMPDSVNGILKRFMELANDPNTGGPNDPRTAKKLQDYYNQLNSKYGPVLKKLPKVNL